MEPTPSPKPAEPKLAPLRPLAAAPSGAGAGAGAKRAPGERLALVSLDWSRQDIENRLGIFKAGRYTSVNRVLATLVAMVCTAAFLGLMTVCLHSGGGLLKRLGQVFMRPNNLYATVPATLFFFLGLAILAIKFFKLRLQYRALELAAVPQHHEFVLNETTAKTVLERLRSLVDDVRHFILLNRIERALSSLHNIGGVSDVSTILQTQAENDENQIASSYALINAMTWAIPVLGFVGTVLGLTLAMANFNVGAGDPAQIKDSLGQVVSGLSTAFETTLVGLVFALVLHLLADLMQERETDFLDECNDYCHAHVVSKLRVRRDELKPA
jgi:biopolymer transport protein ExbB/TolQ